MKLYSALYNDFRPLDTFYPNFTRVVIDERNLDELQAPGILILWGGSDIHPSLYGRLNEKSYVGNAPSKRDMDESKIFALAIERGIFTLGVCRGAQLACAGAGGILVQHVDSHGAGGHRITTDTGETMITSSAHHQMMYPWKIEHSLLAWSSYPRSTVYIGLSDEEMGAWPTLVYPDSKEPGLIEPEVVWFPTVKCLGVQGHPEWMDPQSTFNQYVRKLIDAYAPTT